ncbi:MAG: sulfite exporter TauE/SafE family protein [Planctomycetes bacterium]|nr:sulfite exporter TauE/SafE family protein [Planctomycetota bacterium]
MIELLPTPWHWANAIGIALVVGAAKTGVPGLGFLAVPWLAWVLAPNSLLSVGALLPLLICADIMAVWLYRKNPAIHHLWQLLPWVLIGLGVGAALILGIPAHWFNPTIGGIVLAMILVHLWRKWRKHIDPPGRLAGAGVGIIAGTTTTLANAAGPVMNIYLLAQRMPKEEFIAAGAWFFFVVNLLKVPLFLGLGWLGHESKIMINSQTLLMDACLVPAVVAGSLLGRRVVPHIPQRTFESVVLLLAAAGAIRLLLT